MLGWLWNKQSLLYGHIHVKHRYNVIEVEGDATNNLYFFVHLDLYYNYVKVFATLLGIRGDVFCICKLIYIIMFMYLCMYLFL